MKVPTRWPRKFELRKRKDDTLGTRIYSSRTNSEEKEGITRSDGIRIRFIVCLSFIKLNWWQAMDFCILLILIGKGLRGDIAQHLRESSRTTGRIEKNEWIKMIIKEKESEWTTVRNENDWWKELNHREELEEQICLRGFRCRRTKRSWAD